MSKQTDQSPSPSLFGYSLGRRTLLKGAAGAGAAAAARLVLPGVHTFAQASPATPSATASGAEA